MSKKVSSQDPFELIGMVSTGGPGALEAMAEALVEEYVRLGWTKSKLMTLFRNPTFMATHRIYRHKGEDYVLALIERTMAQWTLPAKESADA